MVQSEFGAREKDVRDGISKIKAQAAQLDKDAAILPESERIRKQRELADSDREIQRKLRCTRDQTIIEDCTSRGKRGTNLFWGAVYENGEWIGENVLGKSELRFEALKKLSPELQEKLRALRPEWFN